MPVFPGNRPASVTTDPEVQYTGPLKSVFPGSRPANVSYDPEHEGDTNARKGHFPTSSYQATADALRAGDPAQTNNSGYGHEGSPGGNYSAGAVDPEEVQSEDAVNLAKPSAVTAITATPAAGAVSVVFTPGAVPGDTYTLTLAPGGAKVTGEGSPLAITGLAAGAHTGTIVGRNQNGNGASAAVSSFTVT